jgi:hypothetical protein
VATAGPGSGGGGGDITAVLAGTGLDGGGVSGSITINLEDTTVTPGTYGNATLSPQITVNAQGQITDVTEVAITGAGGGGGGDTSVERFKLNYASNGFLNSTEELTSGITSVVIDSANGGEVTITFNNSTYNLPPASVIMYGYDYINNKYVVSPLETTMTLREVEAGGSSGSPTLFDGADTVVLRLRLTEEDTGASRNIGTTTHAWIQFTMAG